jgi:type I restriction enzyme M protein
LKNLHAQSDRRGLVVRDVFEDAYNYMKSGTLMRQVINKINEIDFNISEDRHLFGDIYEQILRDLQSAGNAGEYYTPRAINNIRKNYVKSIEDEEKLQKSISGVEKKPLPHLLCVTNMLLHGIEVPSQIRHDNIQDARNC